MSNGTDFMKSSKLKIDKTKPEPKPFAFFSIKIVKKKKHKQKTKKFRSYIENKQKFMHVQMALGISGEQINIVGV